MYLLETKTNYLEQRMATPTSKSPEMEQLYISIFGIDRRAVIENNCCATCHIDVIPELGEFPKFKDMLSIKEFRISGMCQRCQDEVFS